MFYVSQIQYFNLALYSHFRVPLNHVGSFKMALVLNKLAVGRIQTQFCRCLHNFNMTKEVELAIKNGNPVVALGSTIPSDWQVRVTIFVSYVLCPQKSDLIYLRANIIDNYFHRQRNWVFATNSELIIPVSL